jgi:glycosyltransferase involved in cell wall biosynthesis
MTNPKVSVTILTYNLEDYIEQCLTSVLEQSVNFDIEIIIGDDCSTDNTRIILQTFQERYPHMIKLILRQKNIGQIQNYLETMHQCKGEYIAHIDADDYMLPDNLQQKADYLDGHPECTLVHNRAQFVDEKNRLIQLSDVRHATRGDINNLIVRNEIINSAKMFRRSELTEQSFEIPQHNIGHDWFFDLRLVQHGKICYLPTVLSAYRIHTSSTMNKVSFSKQVTSALYVINASKYLDNVTKTSVGKAKALLYEKLSKYYFKRKHYNRAWILLKGSLANHRYSQNQIKLFVKLIPHLVTKKFQKS